MGVEACGLQNCFTISCTVSAFASSTSSLANVLVFMGGKTYPVFEGNYEAETPQGCRSSSEIVFLSHLVQVFKMAREKVTGPLRHVSQYISKAGIYQFLDQTCF